MLTNASKPRSTFEAHVTEAQFFFLHIGNNRSLSMRHILESALQGTIDQLNYSKCCSFLRLIHWWCSLWIVRILVIRIIHGTRCNDLTFFKEQSLLNDSMLLCVMFSSFFDDANTPMIYCTRLLWQFLILYKYSRLLVERLVPNFKTWIIQYRRSALQLISPP